MREYLWRRRQDEPDRELWRRAKKRARDRALPFNISVLELVIPPNCPVLGIPLRRSDKRSANSPSLDRIDPQLGYVSGNVRVISDKANRLKGARNIDQLLSCADRTIGAARIEFQLVAEYVRREALLRDARTKSAPGNPGSREWTKIVEFLDQVFAKGQLIEKTQKTFLESCGQYCQCTVKYKCR